MKNLRDIATISMFNPLYDGDQIELDGPEGGNLWTVKAGGYGWSLKRQDGGNSITHPTIHDIFGMADLIGAILECAKGYSK